MMTTTRTSTSHVPITRHGIVLEKTKLEFENEGVFNPACIRVGDQVRMFYRAVRTGNHSTIGACTFNGPLELVSRDQAPVLTPQTSHGSQGIEDPRITRIDDTYYLTFSVYDGTNVMGTYATSKDLRSFSPVEPFTPRITYGEYKKLVERCPNYNEKYLFHYKVMKEHGLSEELENKLMLWDKNLTFFPRKFDGKFALLHRLHPGIQIVYFNDTKELTRRFWEEYIMTLNEHIVMDPQLAHESSHIGGGAPPIETEDGWLIIYHAAEDTPQGFVYHACAALLDRDDPRKVLARLDHPLISPKDDMERVGMVKNIVFPSGAVVFDNELYIYYGGADERIAVASVKMPDLLHRLRTLSRN
ncbi:MAG: pesticidal protein Cry7Aa [Flavobacteriales bacterium]